MTPTTYCEENPFSLEYISAVYGIQGSWGSIVLPFDSPFFQVRKQSRCTAIHSTLAHGCTAKPWSYRMTGTKANHCKLGNQIIFRAHLVYSLPVSDDIGWLRTPSEVVSEISRCTRWSPPRVWLCHCTKCSGRMVGNFGRQYRCSCSFDATFLGIASPERGVRRRHRTNPYTTELHSQIPSQKCVTQANNPTLAQRLSKS